MAIVNNSGVRIHYKVERDCPSDNAHARHGGSIENWVNAEYVAALKDELRLILIDSRGFGESAIAG
jgi:pimeloyl-ACP methyl ester carboxylesterase